MQTITVSSKGQIALPKKIREALKLSAGTKLTLEVKGHQIVLSKEPAWQELAGALADCDFDFAEFRKRERELDHRKFGS